MMLPGGATIPAVHADRERSAERTERRAVEIAAEDLRPERIMTPDAFHNALVTLTLQDKGKIFQENSRESCRQRSIRSAGSSYCRNLVDP